ncbi:hypothetical protein ACE38F_08110 [Bacillus mycoides]|uniref:hypothetical protein n=1 Tax=Bacillus mycoides TaxID=1405 RepID=UPI0035CBA8A2
MVKLTFILIVILILDLSSSTLSTDGYFSPVIEWSLMIISIILNITAVIGLSLHVFVYQPMKRFEKIKMRPSNKIIIFEVTPHRHRVLI